MDLVNDYVAIPRAIYLDEKPHPETGARVMLTVMHLNHEPWDCRAVNLKSACQLCHNRYDAEHRAESRARRRDPERQLLLGEKG